MFKKLLIATDGSETAEKAGEFAVNLAEQMKCDLFCLFVADAAEHLAGMDLAEMYLPLHEVILEKLEEEGWAAVKRIEDMAAEKAVTCKSEVVKGPNPVKEIIEAAKKEDADLIIVGAHGKKTLLMDLALGEIPLKLLAAELPCPVTVVKP